MDTSPAFSMTVKKSAGIGMYVNNPDYNAYAAALLLLSKPDAAGVMALGLNVVGPLLTWYDGQTFLALALDGQVSPHGSPFFSDFRTFGMQPLWMERDGHNVFEPPVYRGDRASMQPPPDSWLPYVEHEGGCYAARTYQNVRVEESIGGFEVQADAVLEAWEPLPTWERR